MTYVDLIESLDSYEKLDDVQRNLIARWAAGDDVNDVRKFEHREDWRAHVGAALELELKRHLWYLRWYRQYPRFRVVLHDLYREHQSQLWALLKVRSSAKRIARQMEARRTAEVDRGVSWYMEALGR